MIVCLSGRGDKDVNTIANYLAGKGYLELITEHMADEIEHMPFAITLKSEMKESRKINWSRRS